MKTSHEESQYFTNQHFNKWLNENFDPDQIQDLLDSCADDGLYPQEFIDYQYDAMRFDKEKTVYPIQEKPIISTEQDNESGTFNEEEWIEYMEAFYLQDGQLV